MARSDAGTVLKALNASIEAAVRAGSIDKAKHAALIASARKVAGVMDEPGWPIICAGEDGRGGKFDNVSPSTLLKYCEALGICPDLDKAKGKAEKSSLDKLRGNIRLVGGS